MLDEAELEGENKETEKVMMVFCQFSSSSEVGPY
jgi:hypothetical protein